LRGKREPVPYGETTAGVANPRGGHRLSDHFGVFIPAGRAINPLTRTNWEGTGIKPDKEIKANEALKEGCIQLLNKLLKSTKDKEKAEHVREALKNAPTEIHSFGSQYANLPKIGEYERPHFISFDIYGTVLHWFDGLADSLKAYDVKLDKDLFDQIKDFQGQAERESFRPYSEITAESLIQIVGLSKVAAEDIAKDCWRWPLFGDSQRGMQALMKIAPWAALTNSDLVHGRQI
jgi:hypothetical protein